MTHPGGLRFPASYGRLAGLVAAAAVGALVIPGSVAVARVAGGSLPPSNAAALDLLVQGARAERALAYSGEQQVVVLGRSSVRACKVTVRHDPGDGVLLTVQAVRPSPATKWAALDKSAIPEMHEPDAVLPGGGLLPQLGDRTVQALAANYTVTPLGRGMVAVRPVDGVELQQRDGGRAAEVWLDAVTSLPLKREVFRADGSLAASSAFTSVAYRDVTMPQRPYTEPVLGRAYSDAQLPDLNAAGWHAPDRLPGGLQLFGAHLRGGGDDAILQLTYSDGLSTLSVFEQQGSLDTSALSGWQRVSRGDATVWEGPGVPDQVAWSSGGYVYTVVADDPGQADVVVSGLPHAAADDGVWDRVHSGLDRLGSWLNPFG